MDLYEGARDDLWPGTRSLREWAENEPVTALSPDFPDKDDPDRVGKTCMAVLVSLKVGVFDKKNLALVFFAGMRAGMTDEEWRNRVVHQGPRDDLEGSPQEVGFYVWIKGSTR